MDFSTLSRRELQTLCKRNKLPANLTNVAMADSLKNLELVEGIEDLLNQSPQKTMNGSLSIPRTAGRTSVRRKPIIEEPESSQTLTRSHRVTRRAVAEEVVDQEKTEVVPKTPAAPSTRRRAPATSACKKMETQKETASVQKSVYNTRRSVRLLEKTMASLSLGYENTMPLKMNELSTEMNNDLEKTDDGSVDKGSSMQIVSGTSSERVDVSEVSLENEGQLKGDVEENSKADVIEVDDFEQKSESESEVYESKSASDDIVVSEVMDAADDKKPNDEGTENCLAAKVSAEDMDHFIAAENPEDDITAVEDQNLENDDSDSKSAAGETEEVKDVANVEEAAKPKALTLSLSGEQQPMLGGKESMYEVTEADYNEKFDFESDSIKDGGSGSDFTEGEFSEDEATDENSVECEEFESSEGEEFGDESLVDANNVTEVAEVVTRAKMQEINNSKVDVCAKSDPAVDKAPILAPFEAEQLSLQFPRPTFSKPGKSPSKKRSDVMSYIFDDNEENIDDGTDNGAVEIKRDADATDKDSVASELEAKSLRQLRKMLKSQLKIKTEDKMLEKPRTALQEVPENQMVGGGN
ncbi:hypothetical protein D8674_042002 [Pyrus ussuriensis x Pyrus communis]|uniref:Uncharacterized protein n=1 Tax=Pyrus ussuriensis x Pyrus communis TaxID=2448454 RepID=A0A5N5GFD9_9ROSA|nr:hypothetical protein D8674_042002 [Pyrus ussuriensis x Pyrus communis]